MLGQHPKTGKPIRILQTETSIYKNAKTLVFPSDDNSIWNRYDVGRVGAKQLEKGQTDVLILCEKDSLEADATWLKQEGAWRSVKLILASNVLLKEIGEAQLKELEIGNLICLEEVGDLYPFVEGAWDTTVNDAKLLAGLLLRMNLVMGAEPSKRKIEATATLTQPRQLWMITQYYRPEKSKRAREIKTCLEKNLLNPFVDKMVLLNETDMTPHYPKEGLTEGKIHQEVIGKRLTYATVLEWIEKNAPANTLCVFANSDIYLDLTWKLLWSTTMEDRFLSLLRYEADEDKSDDEHQLFGPRADSQDTWVVLSDSVKSKKWDYKSLDFPFGKAGCDNAINVEMLRAKFLVVNPALTLRTHHVHTSQIRNYDPQDIVDKPMYFYIQPTALHEMNPLFSPPNQKTIDLESFSRPVRGSNDTQLKTFCKMLARGDKYKFEAGSQNTYTPIHMKYYEADRVFQTIQGLAYSYSSLYVGKSKAASEAWNKCQISGLSPSLMVETGLIAPFPDEYAKSNVAYLLHYISNILLLREQAGGTGEFWSPRHKQFTDALLLFQWNQREVPVLPRDEGMQVWCKKAYIVLPGETDLITREQVKALRDNLRVPHKDRLEEGKVVVMFDEEVCNRDFLRDFEAKQNTEVIWPGQTSVETIATKLRDATTLIFSNSKDGIQRWGWSWLMPRGSHIIEIQNEMNPDGDCLHFCGAAELNHSLCITPKSATGLTQKTRETLITKILGLLGETKIVEVKKTLPVLVMPKQPADSFFGHAGDSFREMARLWADKGYVTIREDPSAHQVWLNKKGDVLLYDRPNYDWLNAAPKNERVYRLALFGNPAPIVAGKAWSFWPRRPALVEQICATEAPSKPFEQRKQRLVLYGKIENNVQKERRSGYDWASACSEFIMPVGAAKTYPFTQEEYLYKLTEAQFGLCLPGYGWKCHREVECMAMGCVPIVTPDVDMKNYANPPVEGTHYFVAQTPGDAVTITTEVTEEKWAAMSAACRAWWKENVSVDGMWNLTQKLINE